jgi:DNA-binding beta-propeller fold protein YncE
VNGDGQTATVSGTPTDVATAQSTISLSQGGVTLATHAATFSDIENLDTAGGIGDYPTGMVADSTDRKMFVAATSSNAVDAIDAASNPVAAGGVTTAPFTAAALSQPDGLGYAGGTLFASNFASPNLAQLAVGAGGTTGIDSTDHPTTGCFHAEGVAPDSSDSDVFVACFGSELHDGSLSVLSPTGALLHSFAENDASPAGVAPDGTTGDAVVDEVVAGAPPFLLTYSASANVGYAELPQNSASAGVAYARAGSATALAFAYAGAGTLCAGCTPGTPNQDSCGAGLVCDPSLSLCLPDTCQASNCTSGECSEGIFSGTCDTQCGLHVCCHG